MGAGVQYLEEIISEMGRWSIPGGDTLSGQVINTWRRYSPMWAGGHYPKEMLSEVCRWSIPGGYTLRGGQVHSFDESPGSEHELRAFTHCAADLSAAKHTLYEVAVSDKKFT